MNVMEAITAWEQRPFKRGTGDCCAFVDHVLYKTHGLSALPIYDDDESANNILKEHGGLQQAVTYHLGREMVAAHHLKAGDVVLLVIRGHEAIGILMPNGNVAVVFEGGGLREISPDFVDGGWVVGR